MFKACARGAFLLVDTDVLIWLLRGKSSAKAAVEACAAVELSAITYMELLQGVRSNAELRLLRQTVRLNGWRILPLTEAIGHRATLYIERFGLSHGLRLADALIAASTVEAGDMLLTANARQYRCISEVSIAAYAP